MEKIYNNEALNVRQEGLAKVCIYDWKLHLAGCDNPGYIVIAAFYSLRDAIEYAFKFEGAFVIDQRGNIHKDDTFIRAWEFFKDAHFTDCFHLDDDLLDIATGGDPE